MISTVYENMHCLFFIFFFLFFSYFGFNCVLLFDHLSFQGLYHGILRKELELEKSSHDTEIKSLLFNIALIKLSDQLIIHNILLSIITSVKPIKTLNNIQL